MPHFNDVFSSYCDIYTQSFVVRPNEIDGELCVTLIEDDKTAKLKALKIYNVPKKTILLPLYQYSKLCHGNILKKILKNDPGIFMCCDYVLITINNDELYLIFIEMKSNKIDNIVVKKQFKGATCFIEYCNAIIEHFYGIPSLRSVSLNMRYYLVYQGTLNKSATKLGKDKRRSSPDNFCRHPVGNYREASVPFGIFLG